MQALLAEVEGILARLRPLRIESAAADAGTAAARPWTQDVTCPRRFAHRLRAGTVRGNRWRGTDTASAPGGTKRSGHGRETGRDAIALYGQTKGVRLAQGKLP
jgi:acyl-CoA reductase-like NAD-dependent aldehyde dehydrogenase